MFLPETFRLVVGNGAQQGSGLHRALISYLRTPKASKLESELASADSQNSHEIQSPESPSKRFRFLNPMVSLRMPRAKDLALITTIYGVCYMNFSCLQASLSTIFIALYNFSELNAGLTYLPFGAGSVTALIAQVCLLFITSMLTSVSLLQCNPPSEGEVKVAERLIGQERS